MSFRGSSPKTAISTSRRRWSSASSRGATPPCRRRSPDNPQNTWFGNLDLIGFVKKDQKPSDYSPRLLQFFADVEREWVKMGGFPHNGKMYGFYDPTAAEETYTPPFNPNFLADLRRRRGARLDAFAAYRESLDPKSLFYNKFLQSLLEL